MIRSGGEWQGQVARLVSLLAAILAEHTGAEEADTMANHRQSYQLRNTALKYNLIAAEQLLAERLHWVVRWRAVAERVRC